MLTPLRSARLALVLSAAVGATVVAAPDAALAKGPSKAAKKIAKKAKKLLKKKDYDGAIEKYEEAYTEDPSPSFQLGIAKALTKKGEPEKALDVLTRVSSGDHKKSAKKAAKLKKKLLKKLKKTHSEVTVNSTPDGAQFVLTGGDDTEIKAKTPWADWLAHSKYKVAFSHEGYEDKTAFVVSEKKATPELAVKLDKAKPPEPEPEPAPEPEPKAEAPAEEPPKAEAAPAEGEGKGGVSMPALIALGTGTALMGGGVVFGVLTNSANDKLDSYKNQKVTAAELQKQKDEADSNALLANALLGAGVVAVGAGVALLVMGGGDEAPADAGGDEAEGDSGGDGEELMRLMPVVTPGGFGIAIGGVL